MCDHRQPSSAALCEKCLLIQDSSRGPWWADGWAKYKEDFDKALPPSPRTQLLANFDALDVQKGEKLAQLSVTKVSALSEFSLGCCKFGNVIQSNLRGLVSEDALEAASAAEEMITMLDTKKIKQSSALQEWRETFLHDVPRGPRRGEVLHLATCSSVIMDVHCMAGSVIDRAFTNARTRIAILLYKLVENNTANSAELLMHGLVHGLAAQSSTPMYSMEISDISLPSSQAVKPLLLALANCLESECLILEKNAKQRLVDAAEEDSGSVAKTDGNVLLEMEKKEARAAAANRERQSSQLLQEKICAFMAEVALQTFARPYFQMLLISAPHLLGGAWSIFVIVESLTE